MTTFKNTNRLNIVKYRVATNITEYNFYIKMNLSNNHYSKFFDDKAIFSCKK